MSASQSRTTSINAPDAGTSADFLSDLLEDIRCEGFSFFDASYATPWSETRAGSPEALGYFVQRGEAWLEVAGGPKIELEAGDLVFIPPAHAHRLSSRGANRPATIGHAVYRLDRTRARPLMRILPSAVVLKSEQGEMSPWVRPLADLIMELRDSVEPGSLAILRRLAEASVMRSLQQHLLRQLVVDPRAASAGVFRIGAALQAIHRNPERDWSLAALAREACMSRTVFAQAFTEAMGEAPGQYLAHVRMAHAKALLASSALPLAEVAVRVGYGDEVAFGRAFKRLFGTTPGQFRRAGGAERLIESPGRAASDPDGAPA